MASITKRPDGKWRARYRGPDGREHSKHFARRVDGQRWLDEITASVLTGAYVDPVAGRITFGEYAEQWRASAPHGATTRALAARTLTRYVYPGTRPRAARRGAPQRRAGPGSPRRWLVLARTALRTSDHS